MVFHELRREPGIYSRVMAGMALQKSCMFSNIRIALYLRGPSWDTPEAWKCNRVHSQGELEAQGPFLPATGILGFLSIFKRSQPSSNFEAFISP